MSTDYKLQNVVVDGTIFTDDRDNNEILDVFESVRDIDLPAELDSQIVNITKEDMSESALIFSDGLPSGPMIRRGSVEMITLSFDDDGDVSVIVDLSPDFIDVGVNVFDVILSTQDVHVLDFSIDCTINARFEDLDFSIEGPDDFEYKGVKFSQDETNFIVQSSRADSWGDRATKSSSADDSEDGASGSDLEAKEETTSVDARASEHFDVSESGDFITERIDLIEETIDRMCQE